MSNGGTALRFFGGSKKMKKLVFAACIASVAACPKQAPEPTTMEALESIPEGQAADIAKTVESGANFMTTTDPEGVRPALRDAHSKAHGCVRATVAVSEGLDPALRKGVFAEPSAAAWPTTFPSPRS
jgi:hypothetical protein